MLKFLFAILLPVGVFIYTLSFGRWLSASRRTAATGPVYVIAVGSLGLSGYILWRMLL